jgi:hypothetical protein
MVKTGSTSLDRFVHSAAGKILITTLQSILLSLPLLLVFFVRPAAPYLLLKFTLPLAVGLLSGFSARRILKENTPLLQNLTAFSAATLSLLLFWLLSGGFLGITLSSPETGPNWEALIQLFLAAAGSMLALRAFRKPQIEPAVRMEENRTGQPPVRRLPFQRSSNSARLSRSHQQRETTRMVRARVNQKPDLDLPKITRKNSFARSSGIKFRGEVEHICPYCLETVQEHDPRGVKICPICKTRHHADCWGITGTCQIPHSHP